MSEKEINDAIPAASPSFRTSGFYRDEAPPPPGARGIPRRSDCKGGDVVKNVLSPFKAERGRGLHLQRLPAIATRIRQSHSDPRGVLRRRLWLGLPLRSRSSDQVRVLGSEGS